jgi:hypothetical protein
VRNKLNYLSVGGFGISGGTAILDLMREFDNFNEVKVEFRLIKDPYGILDLQDKLTTNWDSHYHSDIAIKDFLWLAKNLNRNSRKLSKYGHNYSKIISKEFIKDTTEYIEKLSQFKFYGIWHLLKYKKNFLQQIINKIFKKLNKENLELMYYSKINNDSFIRITKDYINSIFNHFLMNNKTVLLHNAIPTHLPGKAMKYFDTIKIIVVDRDPRDIYCDIINKKIHSFLGTNVNDINFVQKFVQNFIDRRENLNELKDNKNILYLHFEDIILKYEKSLYEIYSFLDLSKENHVYKLLYFNPEKSLKNIGLWKTFNDQKDIKYIEEKLGNYLYNT